MPEQNIVKKLIQENIVKNIIVLIIVFACLPSVKTAMGSIANTNTFGNLLTVISTLLVTVCFANFAFTYERSKVTSTGVRMLSHTTTFLFLLIIALLLGALVTGVSAIYPNISGPTALISILLYLSIVLYDFWDILRAS